MSELVGEQHQELLQWLLHTWQPHGVPVCFLQGFSGAGKTSLAREFLDALPKDTLKIRRPVDVPESGEDLLTDLLLDLAMELELAGIPELAQAVDSGEDLGQALQKLINTKPVVIVIDEFQRAFDNAGQPLKSFQLFTNIAHRTRQPGRVLLLSNRGIDERARWAEPFEVKTLSHLKTNDAVQLLNRLLQDKNREQDIAAERRQEVVKWLGGNPRALQMLVASLDYDSLEDLIGANPDTWDLRDRQISSELLYRLEENLLQRVLINLPDNVLLFLRRLAIYRKTLQVEALKSAASNEREMSQLRNDLIGRFLLERDNKYYRLNPVAREISKFQIEQEDPKNARTAHEMAAEHYLRHFKAKQIVDSGGRLGGYFVEARYHLSHAGRVEEISQWANVFASHLRTQMSGSSPIPKDPAERDAKIALLSGLLEHGGALGLEYYLARLLKARRQSGDLEKALKHVRKALSSTHVDSWRLLLELEEEVNGRDAAIRAAKDGIAKIPPDKNVFALYQSCGELLARQNKLQDAVDLLEEGIAKIPPDKGSVALYQSCGELLARQNKLQDAVVLLKDGIDKIPPERGVFSLYQSCGELLARQDKLQDAVVLLKDGIDKIPPDKGSVALYQSCGELLARQNKLQDAVALLQQGIRQVPENKARSGVIEALFSLATAIGDIELLQNMLNASGADEIGQPQKILGQIKLAYLQNDWASATQIAKTGRQQFPNYLVLTREDVFACLAMEDIQGATAALPIEEDEYRVKHPLLWLRAWLNLLSNNTEQAQRELAAYLGQEPNEPVSQQVLLRLWDTPHSTLRYHFPILPPALTGLSQAVRCLQHQPPILNTAFPLTHTVYVEGETDELYLKKAIELFNKQNLGLDIKTIGSKDASGAKGSGETMMKKFEESHKLRNGSDLAQETTLLYDSDVKKPSADHGKLHVRGMPVNSENELYTKGIENLLTLPDDFPKQNFYTTKEKLGAYSEITTIQDFQKMKLCKWICEELPEQDQRHYLQKFEEIFKYFSNPLKQKP